MLAGSTPPANSGPVRRGATAVSLTDDCSEADFEATVARFEPVVDCARVTLEGPEGELHAVIPNTRVLEEGRDIGVALDRTKLYPFDPDNGTLIATSRRVVLSTGKTEDWSGN